MEQSMGAVYVERHKQTEKLDKYKEKCANIEVNLQTEYQQHLKAMSQLDNFSNM